MKSARKAEGEKRYCEMSTCGVYRYTLTIAWDEALPLCVFVGVNPSTADEFVDDPTIRRCKSFAKDWGYGGLLMLNLFAFRATDPEVMKRSDNQIGSRPTLGLIPKGAMVVAAWGKNGRHRNRNMEFQYECQTSGVKLYCLGLNNDGTPKHPLYLSGSVKPERFI